MQLWIEKLITDVSEVIQNDEVPDEQTIWDRDVTKTWLEENERDFEWAGQLLTDLLALKDFEKD